MYCWSQIARPELGEGEGGGGGGEVEVDEEGGGGDEGGVVDAEGIRVVEEVDKPCMSPIIPPSAEVTEAGKFAVLNCASAPEAAVCISPTIPPSAEVTEAGKAVEPGADSICVSGQEPSLFP